VHDKQGGKRAVRRPPPALTATELPDDFDAITLPATSARASAWLPDEHAGALECTFGGAVERVVRSSAIWLDGTRTDELVTQASMEGQTLSFLRSRRTSRDVREMDEPGYTSLGRRARDVNKRGARRLVPKRVLEDTPERTVTLWRTVVALSGDALSDGSTLAGSGVDEFGQHKPGGSSHPKKLTVSTSSKANSKLGYVPPRSESFHPATAESMLGLADVSDSIDMIGSLITTTVQATNYPHFARPPMSTIRPLSPSPIYALPPSITRTKTPSSSATMTPAPLHELKIPRMPLRPRRLSNTSVPANTMPTLEGLLSGCQPSLLHLRPVLRDLG
jgi:hypothetical protein